LYDITPDDLKEIRVDIAQMTQEQFAHALGLTKNSVQKYEAGDALPSLYVLTDIAEKFGVHFEITPERKHPILLLKKSESVN